MHRGKEVSGLLHPFLAVLIEIGNQSDRYYCILFLGDVEEPKISARLVSDQAVRERCALDIPTFLEGVLAQVASLQVHGPDVHRPVTVSNEINPILPKHRILAGARKIGREGNCLTGPYFKLP